MVMQATVPTRIGVLTIQSCAAVAVIAMKVCARSAHAVLLRLLLMILLMLLLLRLFHAAVVAAPAASDVYVPDGVPVAHALVFGESCCCRCIVAVAIMVLVASTESVKNTIQSRNV